MSNQNQNPEVLGASGQPARTGKNFNHSFTTVDVRDPGGSLGLSGNMAYGGSRALYYLKNPALLFQRSAGALGTALVILMIAGFFFHLLFGRSQPQSIGSVLQNPVQGLPQAAANAVREPLSSGVNQVGQAIGATPATVPAPTSAGKTDFPNGLTVEQAKAK